MQNKWPRKTFQGRLLPYVAAFLDFWYIVTFFIFLSEIIMQNVFEQKKCSQVFSLVFKMRLFSDDLTRNKNRTIFYPKVPLNFLSERILSCSVRRFKISWYFNFGLIHGNIVRTGIACYKNLLWKSLVKFATQLAGGLLLKKLKYFEVMLNIFEFSRMWKNVESWLLDENKCLWTALPFLSTGIIKRS